ncbi:HAD family hydrolase, partial [bacterium]|nr:HAD family hydrolase [bacterium]
VRFLENTRFYPKVEETILQIKNVKLGVLSNKPDVFTKALIENSSLKNCFDFVYGTDVLGSLKPDPVLIKKCRGNAQKILFVGDSLVDLETAKNAKISSCIVTYGLGNLVEIKKLKPDFLIDDFSEILKIIENL